MIELYYVIIYIVNEMSKGINIHLISLHKILLHNTIIVFRLFESMRDILRFLIFMGWHLLLTSLIFNTCIILNFDGHLFLKYHFNLIRSLLIKLIINILYIYYVGILYIYLNQ